MKDMVILIDTNVIIDFIHHREPFCKNAGLIFTACFEGKISGCIAAHSITNIFYILRKDYSETRRKEMLYELSNFVDIIGLDKEKLFDALLDNPLNDLEDALQVECALAVNAAYIVTRDTSDFANSAVPAILPEELLESLDLDAEK